MGDNYMKMKKSDLVNIYKILDETYGFVAFSLDHVDDDQVDYINNLLDEIIKAQKVIKNIN